MPHRDDLAVKSIPGRACLVTEMQMLVPLLKPGDHPPNRDRIGIGLAQVSHLALLTAVGYRDRVPGFRHIQPNENFLMRQRNASGARIHWKFTTETARDKLARAYPQPANTS